MIGSWDESNCIFALAPASWGNDNAPASFNTGNMPSYPDSAYQDVTLTDMGAGYGFVNADTCHLNFDGVNDKMTTTLAPTFTNTNNFAVEIWCYWDGGANTKTLFGQYDDADNRFWCQIRSDGLLEMKFEVGAGPQSISRTSQAIGAGLHHLVYVKKNANDGKISIYINGTESSGYGAQETYDLGDHTYTDKCNVGDYGGGTNFNNKIYWCAVYDDALSDARILANYNLGVDMGLIGTNTVNDMVLTTKQGKCFLRTNSFYSY